MQFNGAYLAKAENGRRKKKMWSWKNYERSHLEVKPHVALIQVHDRQI
jgi:hypothetical protein